MILTPSFVFLHHPKAGGTFVTRVLERLLRPRNPVGRILGRIGGEAAFLDVNKHGTWREIPVSHRHLPVVTTVRNPYDRYVSEFEYGFWKRRPGSRTRSPQFRELFPRFPELSFEEFVDFWADAAAGRPTALPPGDHLGRESFRFVDFYFRRPPEEAWPSIDDAYIEGRGWEGDLAPVRFLRMEDLNRELHDYLVGAGFPRDRVEFVLKEGRILPGGSSRPRDRDWTSYYTPALRGKVRRRERLLFSAFPWYDAP